MGRDWLVATTPEVHCLLHAPPSSVPNAPARGTVKKCPRGVKASGKSILFAEAGRPTPCVNLQPLAGLWVEIVITLAGLVSQWVCFLG